MDLELKFPSSAIMEFGSFVEGIQMVPVWNHEN